MAMLSTLGVLGLLCILCNTFSSSPLNLRSLRPRLTNCAPFIEDEDIQDLRVRIQQRQIYWEPLLQKGISLEGDYNEDSFTFLSLISLSSSRFRSMPLVHRPHSAHDA